jgi:predicted esterase
VIPVGVAEKLNAILKGAGADGGFLKFAGGHEIPMAALQKAREFIAAQGHS